MLLAMGSSLLIYNTGLPTGVIVSFINLIGCLGAGWICITIHQWFISKRAYTMAESRIR